MIEERASSIKSILLILDTISFYIVVITKTKSLSALFSY